MIFAVFLATASELASTWVLMGKGSSSHDRVGPSTRWRDSINLHRSPALWGIIVHWCGSLQHRINNSPPLFPRTRAGEKSRLPRQGVPEHPFVGVHLPRTGVSAGQQL